MTPRIQALDMLRAVARKDEGTRIVHHFATDPPDSGDHMEPPDQEIGPVQRRCTHLENNLLPFLMR